MVEGEGGSMRGKDAAALVEQWRRFSWDDRDLEDAIAHAIERAYREGVDTGERVERDRMRKVLGL
jgi:hypothetical protein